MQVIDILEERGFIEAMTSEELRALCQKPISVYCGFDPTGESLHLGNMVAIMGLAWFERCGHTPYAIVGGATGMIGDPSGKSTERSLLDHETIEKNLVGIKKNLQAILKNPIVLNNYDWFKDFTFVDFLRDVGKYFRIGPMLGKESVRARMSSEEGMSFTEFSYQLLQGYDFLHLFDNYGVRLELGGSDQWGNILAGTDLIRRLRSESTYGLTFPLLTKSDGQKFGKSEKGAIWLSPDLLSPYEFYQQLYRVADEDVIKLMRLLTFMDMSEIRKIEEGMKQGDYVPNSAQKRLADEVTLIVHGEEGLKTAQHVTASVSPGAKTTLNAETLEQIAKEMPSCELNKEDVEGQKLIELMVKVGLLGSKGEARRLIRNGGAYLNNDKIDDEDYALSSKDMIEEKLLLLAAGKKNKLLVKIND